jgi:hypothetical protein
MLVAVAYILILEHDVWSAQGRASEKGRNAPVALSIANVRGPICHQTFHYPEAV